MRKFYQFILSNQDELFKQLLEHIELTLVALALASFVGILLGVLISRYRKITIPILGVINVIQTIPSLALLGFLLPFLGIGLVPAIIALFLYALLPIVRNTFTGISGVDTSVKEAAIAMGMTPNQLLLKVELPLAIPYIIAGIKTASVINVGIATLAAFIAAGGLGKFILQGIQLNNTNMILAGAIPASLFALSFDWVIGILQKKSLRFIKFFMLAATAILILFFSAQLFLKYTKTEKQVSFLGGFPSEFIYREDGLKGLQKAYDFEMDYVEMDIGLMYKALQNREVDIISGFSTDGRIQAYHLNVIEDDKNYFPPYEAAAMMRQEIIDKFPQVLDVLNNLENQISNDEMMEMNYQVDELKKQPNKVAKAFLLEKQLIKNEDRKNNSDQTLVIGSKAFTENYILSHIFALMLEDHTNYQIELKLGFGGTKLLMDAMKYGEVDLYPEYTGTALLLLLDAENDSVTSLVKSPDEVYNYVVKASDEQFHFVWTKPLGFNNTFAMMMREEQAETENIQTMSELAEKLK